MTSESHTRRGEAMSTHRNAAAGYSDEDKLVAAAQSPYGNLSIARETSATNRIVQILLSERHSQSNERQLHRERDQWAFSVFSQGDEDGLLLRIFASIGHGSKTVVDLGSGKGRMSNSANLLLHHGWRGWLFDASERRQTLARAFFMSHYETRWAMPTFVTEWLTPGNVAQVITAAGAPSCPDLLSIDLDGDDLWILDALHAFRPRVYIVEYQHHWGPHESVTVPQQRKPELVDAERWYFGASLRAFTDLLEERAYDLVGIASGGFNAVFVAREENPGRFDTVTVDEAFADVHWDAELRRRHARIARLPMDNIAVVDGRLAQYSHPC